MASALPFDAARGHSLGGSDVDDAAIHRAKPQPGESTEQALAPNNGNAISVSIDAWKRSSHLASRGLDIAVGLPAPLEAEAPGTPELSRAGLPPVPESSHTGVNDV